MSIYHCSISNVSRAAGSNSCATLSYISGKKIYDEKLEKTFSYGRKERVLFFNTLLPDYAHEEWANAEVLFNSIENFEKAANARTAKKIEIALPREFNLELQRQVIEEYIKQTLVSEGYAASYAIHGDKGNNNPHAHILIPNRQINKNGEWANKRKMEYALDENGERIPRLDENGNQKTDKNGRKQWVRINAKQNPLDKKEKLEQLRKAWADECNKFLDEKIDHRSYERQGIDLQPTIHIGYAAAEMDKRGKVSDRIEHNKLVRMLNLLRERINTISESIKSLTSKNRASQKQYISIFLDKKYVMNEMDNDSSKIVELPKGCYINGVDCSGGFLIIKSENWKEGLNRIMLEDRGYTLRFGDGRNNMQVHPEEIREGLANIEIDIEEQPQRVRKREKGRGLSL